MTRIRTGITAERLMQLAETVSVTDRPDAPRNSVTYRCGASIYVHKTEWRTACLNRKEPGHHCACNQHEHTEGKEAA